MCQNVGDGQCLWSASESPCFIPRPPDQPLQYLDNRYQLLEKRLATMQTALSIVKHL